MGGILSLGDLVDAEQDCAALRWPDGYPTACPRCGGVKIDCCRPGPDWPPSWLCRACRRCFRAADGTVLQSSKLPLERWVKAARTWWPSAGAVARELGVSYPTARRIKRLLDLTERPAGDERLQALLAMPPDAESVDRDRRRNLAAGLGQDGPEAMLAGLSEAERDTLRALRVLACGATAGRAAELLGRDAGHVRRCLRSLQRRGYTRSGPEMVMCGYGAAEMIVWHLTDPAGQAAALMLPYLQMRPAPPPVLVPVEFWWCFWSGLSASNVNLSDPDDALMAAERLIGSGHPPAANWALFNLPLDALRRLRTRRGYEDGPDADNLDAVISHRAGAEAD